MGKKRVVCWFSAGVTSAIALKIALDEFNSEEYNVIAAMCDTGSEDDDNHRFAKDVSDWLGIDILLLKSKKYKDTMDVYEKTGWLVGPAGARCTAELKKKVRLDFQNRDDIHVFGYDAGEQVRYMKFLWNNGDVMSYAPLIKNGYTKSDCRKMLIDAGIEEPNTYKLGFKNANCLKTGCVKGGAGYWNHYRVVFPDRFDRMAKLERRLDVSINKKNVDGKRVRVFLDELPPDMGNYDSEPGFQCGLFCGLDAQIGKSSEYDTGEGIMSFGGRGINWPFTLNTVKYWPLVII